MRKETRDAVFGEFVRYTGLAGLVFEIVREQKDRPEILCAILVTMGLAQWQDIAWFVSGSKIKPIAMKLFPKYFTESKSSIDFIEKPPSQ